MEEDIHRYAGDDIEVSYDHNRCIHVQECVRGLPGVFDPANRPWVDSNGADADEIAAVIERCPTGALQYERTDSGPAETVPSTNTVTAAADGPLYSRGDIDVRTQAGDETLLRGTRVALCRCGHTVNRPLCDNSHARVFEADGVATADIATTETTDDQAHETERDDNSPNGKPTTLTVTPTPNGPLSLDGHFDLETSNEDRSARDGATLCRCGGSANKPFCDGTHAEIGFSTTDDD